MLMNEKVEKGIMVLSAVAFFVLWSHSRKLIVLLCVGLGLLCGIAVAMLGGKKPERGRGITIAAWVLGVLLAGGCVWRFYHAWVDFPPLTERFAGDLSGFRTALAVLSCVLAVLAVPFCERIIEAVLAWLRDVFTGLDYGELRSELRTCASPRGRGKTVLMLALNLLLAVGLGTLFLSLVFLLPDKSLEAHVRESVGVFEEEGIYPRLSPYFTSKLDNSTDALMLHIAADASEAGNLDRAMMAYYGQIDGCSSAESLIGHYRDGLPYDSIRSYPRYWHGYLLFLRLLLSVMNYPAIRVLNGVCQVAFMFAIAFLMKRRGLGKFILAYFLAWGMMMPLALAKSMQFSSCFYLFSLGVLALLLIPEEKRKAASVFLFWNIGIATAYFDFLTYPMATFGIPSLFLLLLCREDSAEEKLGVMIKNGVCWCVGYGGMWFLKFLLGGWITGQDVLGNGLQELGHLTSAAEGGGRFAALSAVGANFSAFLKTPVTVLVLAFLLVVLFRGGKGKRFSAEEAKNLLPYVLLFFAPIVWYLFASTHSTIHCWFTNKACVVSLFALLCVAELQVEC